MTPFSQFAGAQQRRLENRWTDVFRRDALIHLGIMASIVAGTFQGYLKDRLAGPVPYALAELCFVAAALLWFGTLAVRHLSIRGPGRVPVVVLAVILLPTLYLLHPGTPLVIELAGLRGWAEFPVACLIALTIIRTPAQVRAYVGLVLLLCAVTAAYGIWQYQRGPDIVQQAGALAQIRHGSSIFYSVAGESDFRAFSTFTFPAPFAAMMVFGILLAGGIALSPSRSRRARWVAGALVPLLFVGITVSGTRAAMVVLVLGLLLLGWYRRLDFRALGLLPLLVGALYLGTVITAGRILERFQSIFLHEGLLWTYVYAPITIAARTLAAHPFGLGLGRSGVGVPFAIYRSYPTEFFQGSDGDIGRAAVEMGVFGIALLLIIVIGLLPAAARAVKAIRDTSSSDLALGLGAMIISTGALLLIGSPFSSTPHATIWWFLLGALFKVQLLHTDAPPAGAV